MGAKRWLTETFTAITVRYWARRSRPTPDPPLATRAPSDNLQRSMNLIMPLYTPNIYARGQLVQALFNAMTEVLAGLNNVGTVHFARFDLIDGNLCMISVYDGDFRSYIRDFIASIGDVFDLIVAQVKDPPPLPVALHVEEFIDWVHAHDAFQMPESPVDLMTGRLATLPRDTLLALHRNPNVQLGFYRAYPGFSVAQVRDKLSIGW